MIDQVFAFCLRHWLSITLLLGAAAAIIWVKRRWKNLRI